MVNGNEAPEHTGWKLISAIDAGAQGPVTGNQPMVREMISIHNAMIRSLSAIYLQCVNVEKSPNDVMDFVEYCLCWGRLVSTHHHEEEEYVFPDIEKLTETPGIMEGNVEQHHAFHPGLDSFNEYLNTVKKGEAKYDGKKLQSIIDSFMPTLHAHLCEEIPSLRELEKFDKVDWVAFWKVASEAIFKKVSADPLSSSTTIPFLLCSHDATFEGGILQWPPAFPWVAKMIFRYWYIPINKQWWRFAPCDSASQPKALPFA